MKFYKNTIVIYTAGPPTRDIDALAKDVVHGASFCAGHQIEEVTEDEIADQCGDFFFPTKQEEY